MLNHNHQDVTALHYLAKIANQRVKLNTAEKLIKEALSIAPNDAKIQYDAARIYAAQLIDSSIFNLPNYAKKTLKAYKRAAELRPDIIQYRRALMNFYLRAPSMFGGNKQLALIEVKAIEKLNNLQGQLAMASFYELTKDQDRLAELYNSALMSEPGKIEVLLHRGQYYVTQEQYELALDDFKQIISMTNEQPDSQTRHLALYNLGLLETQYSSDIQQAILALHEYIDRAPYNELLPSKAWAKYYLGKLYRRNGDRVAAQTLYQQISQTTFDKTLKRKLKTELRKLR